MGSVECWGVEVEGVGGRAGPSALGERERSPARLRCGGCGGGGEEVVVILLPRASSRSRYGLMGDKWRNAPNGWATPSSES